MVWDGSGRAGHNYLVRWWTHCGEKPHMGSGGADDTCTDV